MVRFFANLRFARQAARPRAARSRPSPRSLVSGSRALRFFALLGYGLTVSGLSATSLEELETDAKMTPKSFANNFETFRFELNRDVQPPNRFLSRRRGDCDDYAILADKVLHLRGYETRLIHIRLAGMIAHAVCYVTDDKVYLDYNNRAVFFSLARAKPSLREIATKVASSLDANWTSASEFIYSYETSRKTILSTVVLTDPPDNDPPLGGKKASSKINVD